MTTWDLYLDWFKELLLNKSEVALHPYACPQPNQFCLDSRQIQSGEWFIPLQGDRFDGHDYIQSAIDRGASGFLYHCEPHKVSKQLAMVPGIRVGNTLSALQYLAKGWRNHLNNLKVIALTGSVGKTTVKEMLGHILSEVGETLPFSSNFNNEIGVPKLLLSLTKNHRFAIMELGARRQGDIAFLVDIVNPDLVICLNVGSSHMEIFGSQEKIYQAKLEIFSHSRKDAIRIAPISDKIILDFAKKDSNQVFTFGFSDTADVHINSVLTRYDGGMDISLRIHGGRSRVDSDLQQRTNSKGISIDHISLNSAHEAYPINVSCACATAVALGIPLKLMQIGLSKFQGVKGRYKIYQNSGLSIIDDTYNASPESMKMGLHTLAHSYSSQKKVVVLGDMLELGTITNEAHDKLGEICAEFVKPEFLITVGQHTERTQKAAIKFGFPENKALHFDNISSLIQKKLDFKNMGNVLYAKGSRGIGLNLLIDELLKNKT